MNAESLQEQEERGRKFAQALLDVKFRIMEVWQAAGGVLFDGEHHQPMVKFPVAVSLGIDAIRAQAKHGPRLRLAFHAGVLAVLEAHIEEHEAR